MRKCAHFKVLLTKSFFFFFLLARNNDYLQVDLRTAKKVTGVVTQGRARNDVDQWVTSYKVSYSNDGTNFHFVDNKKVFFKDILLVAMWILLLNQRIRVDQLAKRHPLRQGSPNYGLRGQTGSPSHFTLSWKDFVNNQEMIFLQKIVVDLVEYNIFRNNHNT